MGGTLADSYGNNSKHNSLSRCSVRKAILENENKVLLGGAFHYFRIPRKLWNESIAKLSKVFDFIETYIPWGWHEPEEGLFDFTGKTHPMRDLVGFFDIVKKSGKRLIIRPGPIIFAEYRHFGFPKWLLKDKEILQRDIYGSLWKLVPNFNHPKYLERARKWINKVLEVAKPYMDIIIGIQIDNESGMTMVDSFVSPTPRIRDASQYTRKMFREKYGREMPKPIMKKPFRLRSEFKNVGDMMLVQEFMEDWIVEYLKNLKQTFLKFTDKLFLNDSAILEPPINFYKKAKEVAPVYYDLYPKMLPGKATFDMPFLFCYASKVFGAFTENASAECQCGWFDPNVKVKIESTVQLVMGLYAHGAQMINLYIAHDCLEDDGTKYVWNTLLNIEGKETERYYALKKISEFLDSYGDFLKKSMEKLDTNIAILEYTHTHKIDGSDSIRHLVTLYGSMGTIGLLHDMGYNPPVLMLNDASLQDLKKYSLILFPSHMFIEEEKMRVLEKYVEDGGKLVVYPFMPFKDLKGEPLESPLFSSYKSIDIYGISYRVLYGFIPLILWWLYRRWRLFQLRPKFKLRTWQLYTLDGAEMGLPSSFAFMDGTVWGKDRYGNKVPLPPYVVNYESSLGNILVKKHGNIVGFSKKYGKGELIVLGFPLASQFATRKYYKLKRELLIFDFISKVLGIKKRGVHGIERVVREKDSEVVEFIINRGSAKRIEINQKAKVIFSYKGSHKASEGVLDIREDDVVVLSYTST